MTDRWADKQQNKSKKSPLRTGMLQATKKVWLETEEIAIMMKKSLLHVLCLFCQRSMMHSAAVIMRLLVIVWE